MSWKLQLIVLFSCAFYCGCEALPPNKLPPRERFSFPRKIKYFQLTILHINDFHARFVQTSNTSDICPKNEESKCVGGLARVLTASKQLLRERPNSIFLDAGDHFQGTLWHNVYHWNASVQFLNKLPFNAMTLGSHDFDDGISGLVPFLKQVKTPVLVTNIDARDEPKLRGLYKNSTIIRKGAHKVGIIGVISQSAKSESNTGKLKFLDEIKSVSAEAARLKNKGADIIIVLSHAGLDVDKVMAERVSNVDVIVGGRSHSFLYTGTPPSDDEPEDKYPVVVKQTESNRTVLIVHALAYTKYLGNLTVSFDRRGEVVEWEGNPILMDSSIKEDPELLAKLKPWEQRIEEMRSAKVAQSKTFLNNTCDAGECTLANLITDAMVYSYQNKSDKPEPWTYAAISLINSESIKGDIPVGEITYDKLLTVLPYGHTWDVIELKGEDLYNILEESILQGEEDSRSLHWAGIEVTYNTTSPSIVDIKVRCQKCAKPEFEDLEENKVYRVVVESSLVNSSDAEIIVKKHKNHKIGKLDIESLIEYLKKISPVNYKLEQRLIRLED